MAMRLPGSRRVAAGVGFALLLACGDRPQSFDGPSATMMPPSVRAAGDELPSSVVPGPCTPGTWVPCHYYYRDLEGQLQCPMSRALCKPDGTSTYECNAWVETPEGPQPREGSSALDLRDE